jgi:hypothetical protein
LATPPTAVTPPPAKTPEPPPAPPAANPPPAPPPVVDNRPKVQGALLSSLLRKTTIAIHGGPSVTGTTDGPYYGTVYAIQGYASNYSYNTGPYHTPTHPYWSYQPLEITMPASYQDGQMWFADNLRVSFFEPFAGPNNTRSMTFNRPGGFTINPDDQIILNTTIAEWKPTDGSAYYVQLQMTDWNGYLRPCWHVRLPGILRQACTLWTQAGGYAGDYITDDSNPRYQPVTFKP